MDPYTLVIEGIGIVIACVFTVIPAREFAEIFRRLRSQLPRTDDGVASEQPPEGRA